ncbi:hypothetical protein IID24_01395 [Patescibacteria group bacterium]|nr:hypothetical protein [Patescibacteria group bacterium]
MSKFLVVDDIGTQWGCVEAGSPQEIAQALGGILEEGEIRLGQHLFCTPELEEEMTLVFSHFPQGSRLYQMGGLDLVLLPGNTEKVLTVQQLNEAASSGVPILSLTS